MGVLASEDGGRAREEAWEQPLRRVGPTVGQRWLLPPVMAPGCGVFLIQRHFGSTTHIGGFGRERLTFMAMAAAAVK